MDKEIFNKAIQGYVKDQKKYSEPYTVCKDFAGAKARKGFDWSVVVMIDKAASVRAKLKNKAKISGISYQQCLQLFMQEEFIRKLSKSGYEDKKYDWQDY